MFTIFLIHNQKVYNYRETKTIKKINLITGLKILGEWGGPDDIQPKAKV